MAIALCMLLQANRRRMAPIIYQVGIFTALLLPLVTAWQRMAAGRHYLSDVVLGTLLVALLAALLHRVFYPTPALKRC